MDYVSFLTENYVMLIELAGLWILLGLSVHVERRVADLTRLASVLLLLVSLLFHLEQWTQDFPGYTPWRPFLTACVYSLHPLILIVIMEITAPLEKKKGWGLVLLPAAVCVPLYFTSQWTHLVCWFSQENSYKSGPLARLPYFLFAFYLVVFVWQNIRHFRSHTGGERGFLLYELLAAGAGILLYFLLGIDNDYSAIFAGCLLLYYLFMYIHSAKADPLTGLLNRQCYYRELGDPGGDKACAVVSVDMNELKWLNDTLGHDAGDAGLVAVARCLQLGALRNKDVYRVGGDEFLILYYDLTREKVLEDVETMRAGLAQTQYVCAFGAAFPGEKYDLEHMAVEADAAMYADKARLKQAVLDSGGELHGRTNN